MDQYPAPSLVKAIELDDYVPELFASLSSSFGKSYDQNLSQIQGRIGTVMGPLGKLWTDLENIRREFQQTLSTFMNVLSRGNAHYTPWPSVHQRHTIGEHSLLFDQGCQGCQAAVQEE